jgi:phosphonate transport system permease protein
LRIVPPPDLSALASAYEDATRAKRQRGMLLVVVVVAAALASGWLAEVNVGRFIARLGAFFDYFNRLLTLDTGQRVWTDVAEWFWGLEKWGLLLGDTLLMAYLGTLLGAVGGFLLSFAAAANLTPNPWVRNTVKRFLEFCRTVPGIVFALIFVIAFGLGPVPGVLAIAVHTAGALGKLFSEVVENIDMKPVEAAKSTGGNWPETVGFAALPQVLSNFASYALLRFEINVREASVLGFVGAGGIGQDLIEAIRKFYYSDVSAILMMIIATVVVIDIVTAKLRHALIGMEERP